MTIETSFTGDGLPGDFHLVHLGARALGGAGLVMTEMVCVSEEGRITPGCTGLWNDAQVEGWKPVTEAVHRAGGRIGSQPAGGVQGTSRPSCAGHAGDSRPGRPGSSAP